jgi:Protein of unknown function (DUF3667)
MPKKKERNTAKTISTEPVTCRNCENIFVGKNCNLCGEKVFNEKNLSAAYFFKQIIDFFYHYESKVLRSIKLNFFKPGFITKENINGITIPYAKPIQLFLVVNIIFYLTLHFSGVSDYTPSLGDHYYYNLSNYSTLRWAEPIDTTVINKIDNLIDTKVDEYKTNQKLIIENIKLNLQNNNYSEWTNYKERFLNTDPEILSKFGGLNVFQVAYDKKVGGFSKSLIFLIIPFVAIIFFMFFYFNIKYFGSSLILATHFVVYNMCFFIIHVLVDWLPQRIGLEKYGQILSYPIEWIFYNKYTTHISEFIFGGSFEMLHFIFWFPWLFIAFKRLWNLPIWKNILTSYFCCKIFFFLIYGIYKKFLIAFSVWMM